MDKKNLEAERTLGENAMHTKPYIRQTKLSVEPTIAPNAKVENCTFGAYVEIGEYNYLENSSLDDYSYTGQFCFLQNTVVGKFANIAAMVRIGPTNHPYKRPTMHHFTYRPAMFGFAEEPEYAIFADRASHVAHIGHDTWIGHGVIVMNGVTIGDGAVVGSGAVVTKDIPPYAIAVGNPAKVIKYRFDEETIRRLRALRWWDWSYESLKERLADFRGDVHSFLDKYEEK